MPLLEIRDLIVLYGEIEALRGVLSANDIIRLLDLAIRWLTGEPPDVRASEEIRPTLLAIKRGEVPMPDVMALARELTPKLESARTTSPLPRYPDVAAADRVGARWCCDARSIGKSLGGDIERECRIVTQPTDHGRAMLGNLLLLLGKLPLPVREPCKS